MTLFGVLFLWTFALDDRPATFFVLGLGNPHLMEASEGGDDRASDPRAELPLNVVVGRNDFETLFFFFIC